MPNEHGQVVDEDFRAPVGQLRIIQEYGGDGGLTILADFHSHMFAHQTLRRLQEEKEDDFFTLCDENGVVEKHPPIDPGTKVMTTQADMSKRHDWTDEGWVARKWGVEGEVLRHHDSHGLCYDVRHKDGTEGCYNTNEFEIVMVT